jgi:hypothetical protein
MNCINYESENKHLLLPMANASFENENQETKVKSISKNWELMASLNVNKTDCSSAPSKLKSSNSFSHDSNMIRSRPKQIVEKIEKFNSNSNNIVSNNQFQQKIKIPKTHLQQQYSSSSSLTSPSQINSQKTRVNSGGTNSDDCDGSKDDGFETQSNASSSQNSDNNLKLNVNDKSNSGNETQPCNSVQSSENFNGFLVTIMTPKQILSKSYLTKKLDSNETNFEIAEKKNKSLEDGLQETRICIEDFVFQSESVLNNNKTKNCLIENLENSHQTLYVSFLNNLSYFYIFISRTRSRFWSSECKSIFQIESRI